MARKPKAKNGGMTVEIELQAAEDRRAELDKQRAENLSAARDLAAKTMTGDLRDLLLSKLRYEQDKRPWDQRSEAEQHDTIHSVESAIQEVVGRAVELIAASGLPTIRATLDSITVKDGMRLSLTMPKHSEQRFNILEAQGGTILLVVADANIFMGERAPARINPEQGDLEYALVAHSDETADKVERRSNGAEHETVEAQIEIEESESAETQDDRPGYRASRDFTTGSNPLN